MGYRYPETRIKLVSAAGAYEWIQGFHALQYKPPYLFIFPKIKNHLGIAMLTGYRYSARVGKGDSCFTYLSHCFFPDCFLAFLRGDSADFSTFLNFPMSAFASSLLSRSSSFLVVLLTGVETI